MQPYADTRYCDVRASLEIIDQTAQQDASPYAIAQGIYSQLNQTLDNNKYMSERLVTLEPNNWILDGSVKISDDISELQTGYWSGLQSDADGVINDFLRYDFTVPHSSYGITLYFDDKAHVFPSNYTIEAYDRAGVLIASEEVENDGLKAVTIINVEDYERLRFVFKKVNLPYRRMRVCEVIFGIIEDFTGDNTKELKINRSVDINSQALPIGEIDLLFDNSNQRYNMANPEGAFRFLKQGMPFKVELGIGTKKDTIEYENMGTYFYKSSSSDDDALTAKITAQDYFMYLDNIPYQATSGDVITLKTVVDNIILLSGASIPVIYEEGLADVLVKNIDPANVAPCREILQSVLQCAQAVGYMDKSGTLQIKRLNPAGTLAAEMDADNMARVPKIETQARVTQYDVKSTFYENSYQDKEPDEIDQIKTVNNEWIVSNQHARNMARWLLNNSRLFIFDIDGRGNPLLELADYITITDAFNQTYPANITKHAIKYDGGITEEITAVAGAII